MKNRSLIFLASLLAVPHAGAAIVLTDGLVGYFDFSTDFTNKADDVGSNVTGIFADGTSLLSAPAGQSGGIAGNAMRATSPTTTTSQGMTVPIGYGGVTSSTTNLGQSFTVSAWYNLDNPPFANTANRWFVFEGKTDFDVSYGLRNLSLGTAALDGQVFTSAGATGGTPVANQIDVADAGAAGSWHHVLQTYTSNGTSTVITTYVDGTVLANTLTLATANISDTGFNFGRARDGTNNRGFDGLIDEVGLWNRVLNADEITEIRSLGLAGNGIPSIPEPSAALLGSFGLLALLRRRAR